MIKALKCVIFKFFIPWFGTDKWSMTSDLTSFRACIHTLFTFKMTEIIFNCQRINLLIKSFGSYKYHLIRFLRSFIILIINDNFFLSFLFILLFSSLFLFLFIIMVVVMFLLVLPMLYSRIFIIFWNVCVVSEVKYLNHYSKASEVTQDCQIFPAFE